MVSFPARYYDAAKKLVTYLSELNERFISIEFDLPNLKAVLLTGPEGVGKTHSICDYSISHEKKGLKSIVLFGEKFSKLYKIRTHSFTTC